MPGQESGQYSHEVISPLESTSVAHHLRLCDEDWEVQVSCCLPLWMKGNTQLHAAGDVVVVGPADVDGAVVVMMW